jgi:hypothetical protein
LLANTAYWFVLGSQSPGDGTFFWHYAEGDDFVGPGLLTGFADSADSGAIWSYGAGNPYSLQVNVVSTTLPGDYNQDGTVNAADYTVWRNNLGAPAGTLPNDVDGGAIGTAQYATWKANYGLTPSSGAGAAMHAAVPEPATVLLMMLAGISYCRRQNK